MTGDHTTTGTPAFMAPEIILGRATSTGAPTSTRSGCVAYYLLTGELVFEADTPMKMFLQHVQTPPIPPSQRTELPIPRGARRAGAGVSRKGSRPAAAGRRAAVPDGAPCIRSGGWDSDAAQTLVGDAPAGADRSARR